MCTCQTEQPAWLVDVRNWMLEFYSDMTIHFISIEGSTNYLSL